jgi:hypothetical protein
LYLVTQNEKSDEVNISFVLKSLSVAGQHYVKATPKSAAQMKNARPLPVERLCGFCFDMILAVGQLNHPHSGFAASAEADVQPLAAQDRLDPPQAGAKACF